MECRFCKADETDEYPPTFVFYSLEQKEVLWVVCVQCLTNLEVYLKAMRIETLVRESLPADEDIPY